MKTSLRSFGVVLWDAFLPQNVVLAQALGLCPILAMGTDLRSGIAFSVCTVVTLVLSDVLFALYARFIPKRLQAPLYALVFAGLLMGVAALIRLVIPVEVYAHLELFLPLMAVNTLSVYRTVIAPTHHQPTLLLTLADSLGSALGFSLVLCVASALREMTINGTLWNLPLGYAARFPEAAHPFIGFVLLGFMAATLQWVKRLLHRDSPQEVT